jgi:hypothetical protein
LQLVAVVGVLAAPAHAATFIVGSGAGCTHSSIQAAINAAAGAAGPDTILIARNQTYSQQQLQIGTQTLILSGGLANCTASPDTTATQISGAGGMLLPVIRVATTGDAVVALRHLQITGGDPDGDAYGGGIQFYGNDSRLEIDNCTISGNSARFGAGIYVEGNSSSARATLRIGTRTLISGNTAAVSGGGVYAFKADVEIAGADTAIAFNTAADFGGGLRILGPSGTLITSGGVGTLGTIFSNQARIGGGIAVQASPTDGEVQVDFETLDPQNPVRLRGNLARELGGAVYARPDLSDGPASVGVRLTGVSIEENSAPTGAAVYLDFDDSISNVIGPYFEMTPAAGCAANSQCNRVIGNVAETFGGVPTNGGILVGGDASGMNLEGTRIIGNSGGPPLYTDSPNLAFFPLRLEQVLIANNEVRGEAVVRQVRGRGSDIIDTTIAGNTLSGSAIVRIAGLTRMRGSILWQPGKTSLITTSSELGYLLASETASLAGALQVTNADPRFLDPANDNFRLRAASPAVDAAPAFLGNDLDADDLPRDVDLEQISSGAGVRDLGPFERQTVFPVVLNGDFASDVRLWPEVVNNASAFQAEDHAGVLGSGSLRVTESGGSIRILQARRQCVNLPFAATYLLNGRGRGYSTALFRDTLSMVWRLRGSSADCSGAVLREGELALPNNTTWGSAAQPAVITLAANEWTRNSTLEVILVATDDAVVPPNNISVAFDNVTLVPGVLPNALFANGFE